MGIVSGIVVYLITWWTVLFMVLPFGVKTPDVPAEGEAGSAPINPRIREKFIATSILAAVIWCVIYVLIDIKIMDFREIASQMRME